MKQNRFGEKVQNWHRPLRRNQLKHSFRRRRYHDDESMDECNLRMGRGGPVDDTDWLHWREWEYFPSGTETDIRHHRFVQLLADRLIEPPNWLHQGSSSSRQPSWPAYPTRTSDSKIKDLDHPSVEMESALIQLIESVSSSASENPLWFDVSLIRPSIGSLSEMNEVVRRNDWPKHLALNLGLFCSFWIRSPQTFDGTSISDFVKHLFVRYETIDCLLGLWQEFLDLDRLKWQCWTVLLGQGGSLKRVAKRFGWKISKQFQSRLLQANDCPTPIHASMLAEVLSLGGSVLDYQRLSGSPAFIVDPTDLEVDPDQREFWTSTVLWLRDNREQLGDEETQLVLDWALHMRTEFQVAQLVVNQDDSITPDKFSWKGRSARATVERSINYLRDRERQFFNASWQKRGWDWEFEDGPNEWSLIELHTTRKLKEEGRAMSHCVGGYSHRCVSGNSAIFSLRCNENRVLTVQVDPKRRKIMQALGERNRFAHSNEMDVLAKWLEYVDELCKIDSANLLDVAH